MNREEKNLRMDAARQDSPPGDGLAEFGNLTKQELGTLSETSYRRGFHQGAFAALEAVAKGLTVGQLEDWLIRLWAWRRKNHKGEVERPEWISRKD